MTVNVRFIRGRIDVIAHIHFIESLRHRTPNRHHGFWCV
jgi:hypothetical protein